MKKPFLLIAGDDYYPCVGTWDWKGCYTSFEEAREQVEVLDRGFCKEQYKLIFENTGEIYDWFEIIDLRLWTEH